MERIVDYSTLTTAIKNLVDLQVGDSVDGYLQFVETDVGRRLNSRWQEVTESLAVAQAGILFDTQRRAILRVVIDERPLRKMSEQSARATYINATPNRPVAFSISGAEAPGLGLQRLDFWPRPPDDTSYTARISYKLSIPALTVSEDVNWLLETAPDVYYYGAAIHAVVFNGDATNLDLYANSYAQALGSLFEEIERHISHESTVSAPGAGGYELALP